MAKTSGWKTGLFGAVVGVVAGVWLAGKYGGKFARGQKAAPAEVEAPEPSVPPEEARKWAAGAISAFKDAIGDAKAGSCGMALEEYGSGQYGLAKGSGSGDDEADRRAQRARDAAIAAEDVITEVCFKRK